MVAYLFIYLNIICGLFKDIVIYDYTTPTFWHIYLFNDAVAREPALCNIKLTA
jgi:hypothetical protein